MKAIIKTTKADIAKEKAREARERQGRIRNIQSHLQRIYQRIYSLADEGKFELVDPFEDDEFSGRQVGGGDPKLGRPTREMCHEIENALRKEGFRVEKRPASIGGETPAMRTVVSWE